jgi:hypothetical protein
MEVTSGCVLHRGAVNTPMRPLPAPVRLSESRLTSLPRRVARPYCFRADFSGFWRCATLKSASGSIDTLRRCRTRLLDIHFLAETPRGADMMQVLDDARTVRDELVDRARVIVFGAGVPYDSEAAAEAVVPSSQEQLMLVLNSLHRRVDVRAIPGEWDAVRRWLVLVVASHLDAESAMP